jgi:hypothetical protein
MKKIHLIFTFVLLTSANSYAIEEPSQCAVNTIRGQSSALQNPQFVMANCTKQYIRKIEQLAKPISPNYLSNGLIRFGMSKYYGWSGSGLVVTAKNNSNSKLIYATIEIINKESKKKEIFRMMASDVCDPYSMCEFVSEYSFSEDLLKTFWQENSWNFINAIGLGAP